MMNASPTATVASIYRYPVKGLTPEHLPAVTVEAGETLPFDRAYAIEAGIRIFDPDAPQALPKTAFVMLMRHARLARLTTEFDSQAHRLTIRRVGKTVATGRLDDPIGRSVIEQFMAAYMNGEIPGPPRVVSAPGHSFTDRPEKCVSIVNLATVRDIGRIAGGEVDPLRFRANLYIEGAEPWAEFDWLGADLSIGDVRMTVFARTSRCAATEVDPASGDRDMHIPQLLTRSFGHRDCGIYARITQGGRLAKGAVINQPP